MQQSRVRKLKDMTEITRQKIEAILNEAPFPELSKWLKDLKIQGDNIYLEFVIGYPLGTLECEALKQMLEDQLAPCKIALDIKIKISAHAVQAGLKPISGIKNIIGVASGKGGVGKSTTAVNLALALKALGAKVGILDADVYGPNQPHLLGVMQKPLLNENKKLIPIERYGIQSMSMGYLVEANTPVVWRGPMISSALNQLLLDTAWGELDYLIVDLPPGTGDIQLTLAKKVPVSGALIVTTPQDVALLDASRALEMFNRLEVPVLGVIENMAAHICSQCGHKEAIFGVAGGERMAHKYELPLLGQLPLALDIRVTSDQGIPIVESMPNSPIAAAYRILAIKVAATLANRPKSYGHLFQNVVVEKK